MSSVPMRKLELLVLKRDIEAVLELLGSEGCFQLSANQDSVNRTAPEKADIEERSNLEHIEARLLGVGRILGFEDSGVIAPGTKAPDRDSLEAAEILAGRCEMLQEERKALQDERIDLMAAKREADAFAGLSLPFDELGRMSFLSLRIGRIDSARSGELKEALGDRALILPLDTGGRIVAAASRKGRFALDTELAKAGFVRQEFAQGYSGVPPEVAVALDHAITENAEAEKTLEVRRLELAGLSASPWASLLASVRIGLALGRVRDGLAMTGWVYRLSGWVPASKVDELVAETEKRCAGRVAVRSFDPAEVESVTEGKESVPVLLKHGKLASSFESIVLSYGTPLYGDVDPTAMVAFFFSLLFAVMFGDLGQGAVIFLAGALMSGSKRGLLARYRKFGPAFKAAGIGSMIMGLLVGSFFANEEILIPLERVLTRLVLGSPRDRFIQIMPTNGLGSLVAFFAFTLGVGAVINSVGLVVNIYNNFKRGKYAKAFFGKTGLAGASLFWWALFMGVRVATGGSLAWFDAVGFGIPILALFFSEPLGRLVQPGEADEEKPSMVDSLVSGLVELIESVSYYASNTMSFLRVGAFALSHAVLSFVVFTLGELLRERAPAGIVFEILVFIAGNLIIIVLEGLIVAIQAVRLQYYEFFSKFFSETGKTFKPLGFGTERSESHER